MSHAQRCRRTAHCWWWVRPRWAPAAGRSTSSAPTGRGNLSRWPMSLRPPAPPHWPASGSRCAPACAAHALSHDCCLIMSRSQYLHCTLPRLSSSCLWLVPRHGVGRPLVQQSGGRLPPAHRGGTVSLRSSARSACKRPPPACPGGAVGRRRAAAGACAAALRARIQPAVQRAERCCLHFQAGARACLPSLNFATSCMPSGGGSHWLLQGLMFLPSRVTHAVVATQCCHVTDTAHTQTEASRVLPFHSRPTQAAHGWRRAFLWWRRAFLWTTCLLQCPVFGAMQTRAGSNSLTAAQAGQLTCPNDQYDPTRLSCQDFEQLALSQVPPACMRTPATARCAPRRTAAALHLLWPGDMSTACAWLHGGKHRVGWTHGELVVGATHTGWQDPAHQRRLCWPARLLSHIRVHIQGLRGDGPTHARRLSRHSRSRHEADAPSPWLLWSLGRSRGGKPGEGRLPAYISNSG